MGNYNEDLFLENTLYIWKYFVLNIRDSFHPPKLFCYSTAMQQGGVFQMQTYALCGANNSGFFEIYVMCTHGKAGRGFKAVRTFFRRGFNFSRFCADVFYGRPLFL